MTYPPPQPGPPGAPGPDATQAIPALGPQGPGPAAPPPEHASGPDPTRVAGAPGGQADPYGGQPGPYGSPPDPYGGQPGPYGAPAAGPHPGPPPGYPPTPSGPTGGPPTAASPAAAAPPRRTGRVLGRALLVLLVIGALAGTTAWGFVNRSSAEKWRDRAEASDDGLRRSLERVEATETELTDARERLRDLANESAGETDRNRILSDIVAQAPAVTEALGECQRLTADLANDLIAALADPAPDLADLQARTDDVNDVCADALAQARSLEEQIDALGI